MPFDPAEIDKKLAAAHTLNTLAKTTNRVVFDLYDHCALVCRFFIVESNGRSDPGGCPGGPRAGGEPQRAPLPRDLVRETSRKSTRPARGIPSGRRSAARRRPGARGDRVRRPERDGRAQTGAPRHGVPGDLGGLACLARGDPRPNETSEVAGTSFALGVRIGWRADRKQETRRGDPGTVQFLAKEFKTPVVAWRADATGESLRIGGSSGSGVAIRTALEKRRRVDASRWSARRIDPENSETGWQRCSAAR